jgi:hypothetical protein
MIVSRSMEKQLETQIRKVNFETFSVKKEKEKTPNKDSLIL